MRMMIRFTVPVERGNELVESGEMGSVVQEVMEKVQPEAAYFTTDAGERGGMMVFDMQDSSEIPAIAEILFLRADAAVEFSPVMNAEDLQKGLADS